MEIKDKKGNIRILLTNFKKLFNEEPVFISILVEIIMDNAIAKEEITIEFSDLDELVKNLIKLNKTLKQTFYFQHIDEQLQIKFEPEISGNINVSGFLKDKQYVNTLSFSFEMPSTEINYLIKQGNDIIDKLCNSPSNPKSS